ncbi:hypothetical protein [Vibrio crassostreae]|uniref:hypothetical protein n=1 Tax=Vibrio crassostreae TaxID=246167 RepID=UPI0010518417|nr:hypothetical protein [Vibrio crassostreae]TCN91563.1 hypothetical protein EDB51_1332 [Vibrio crassostreae]CAK2060388.1 Outer membrane protein beta-barrel domain-containing protein [Vibrio crassostreae]CAK2816286.1 Outer membrane protein beta-barrel domain-containing protein [Vibrio crassostreae]CAK2880699.1 Outer membrane protein beta-barrel domain-containing protein [Vibrio crassostreae]CAK2928982.1 Outer membrane protein beta-barrel domain-containing protein [Vibrio crassostreae]
MKIVNTIASGFVILSVVGFTELVQAEEKNAFDPTNIDTKVSVNYDFNQEQFGTRIEVATSETNKLFGSYSENGAWSAGGGYLTGYGIIDIYMSGDDESTGYNIGTYVPLSSFGVDTGKWMLFPMAGLNFTQYDDSLGMDDSYGGYGGLFALRPISDKLTFIGYGGGMYGTNHESLFTGAGLGYVVNDDLNLSSIVKYEDTTMGDETNVLLNATYKF